MSTPHEARSLVEILRFQAEHQGSRAALSFLDDAAREVASVTYAELDRQARAIAAGLADSGAQGERALLLYPPGLEYVSALLGCLYAGVIAVPAYPPDPGRLNRTLPRLQAMVADAQATIALTTSALQSMAPLLFAHAEDLAALSWQATDAMIAPGAEAGWRAPALDRDSLAFLQYTSGSTGTPRGVMLSHGNLLHNERMIEVAFEHTPASRVVGWLPFYHDMGLIGNILQPLYLGIPCALLSPLSFLRRPAVWLEAISRFRATTSGGPNFAFDLCVRKMTPEERASLDLSSWTVAFSGAEPVRLSTIDRFAEAFAASGFRREAFYPCYGLAEATLIVSGGSRAAPPVIIDIDRGALGRRCVAEAGGAAAVSMVGCGRTILDQRIAIVDPETLAPAGADRIGEIWVAGLNVAQGYWRRPEAMEATFRARIAGGGDETYLRTGDLGFLRDGELFVAGRLKDLIILRGRNHYPQDLERTAEQSHAAVRPGCSAAFAIDGPEEERLVIAAEVGAGRGAEPAEGAMDAIRRAIVEEHEIEPWAIVLLAPGTIPKTSSGKIQRHACRRDFEDGALQEIARWTRAEPVRGDDAPPAAEGDAEDPRARLAAELRLELARIVAMRAPEIPLDRPLTSLGLDSLKAVELTAWLEDTFGIELGKAELLDGLTLAGLAGALLSRRSGRAPALEVPGGAAGAALPLSSSQQRLWFLQQLAPESPFYNMAAAIRLDGPLDRAALERSLEELTQRHEILRTAFPATDGAPVQQVHEAAAIAVPRHDLSALPPEEREEEVRRRAVALASLPFDLTSPSLLRAALLALGAERHVLVLTLHHIAGDYWSFRVILEELAALYGAHAAGRTPALGPPAMQYRERALAEHAADPRRWEQALAYWRARLRGAPDAIALPGDRPRPPRPSFRGGRRTRLLPPPLAAAAAALARAHGTTPFVVLLAALEATLSAWTGQRDLVIGTVVADRERARARRAIGCFIDFLPIRAQVAPGDTGAALLERTRRAALETFVHEAPFERIVAAVSPAARRAASPLYNVAFLLQRFELARALPLGAGVTATAAPVDLPVALLDLRFLAEERGEDTLLACEYAEDLFDGETAAAALELFEGALERLTAQPEAPIAGLELPARLRRPAGPAEAAPAGVVIAATFTAEPVAPAVELWLERLGLPGRVTFAPYHQVFQQLLDPTSELSRNEVGLNVVLLRLEDLAPAEETGAQAAAAAIARSVDELVPALRGAAARSGVPLLVCICPASPRAARSGALRALRALRAIEAHAAQALADVPGVYVVDAQAVGSLYPVDEVHDPHGEELGRVPYTPLFFAALGTMIARRYHALVTPPYKVIVLDCDGTLWRGVCGEDGPRGVILDEPRLALQRLMARLQEEGMLLCLCSRNNPEDVRAVFEQRPEMPLRLDAIAALRVNWRPKSSNLRSLAEELELGLDSFVFIDDDPVQCAEVRARCPEVLTLELPADDAHIPHFLQHVWAFDRPKVTAEDRKRAALYRENRMREELRASSPSLAQFLADLDLRVDIAPLTGAEVRRVAQLTQRTNQFNLSGRRRQEAEIAALLDGPDRCEVARVRDRFGDYGLVGVVIARAASDALVVDTFLLSCRAMGRGVEHQMLERLAAITAEAGLEAIALRAQRTGRNRPALDFIGSLGCTFTAGEDGSLSARISPDRALGAHERWLAALPEAPQESTSPLTERAPASVRRLGTRSPLEELARDLSTPAAVLAAIEVGRRRARALAEEAAAPRTTTERVLAEIWAEVLGVDAVGITDDFFALGGHSLLATQVMSRVRSAFGAELGLSELFESRTVERLAAALEAVLPRSLPAPPPLEPAPRGAAPPLSFGQERLWLMEQLAAGGPPLTVSGAVRIEGRLDPARLAACVAAVIRRHEALRTTFGARDGRPVPEVGPAGPVELPVLDLRAAAPGEALAEARRRSAELAQAPFDLARGPLVRLSLARIADEDWVLTLALHHLVADGWSVRVLVGEIAALYRSPPGDAAPLPAPALQYADFAAWQRAWLTDAALAPALEHWRRALSGAGAALSLPADRPRPPVQSFRGAAEPFAIDGELHAALRELARSARVTPFMVVLTAFAALLSRLAGQSDLVIGAPVANRGRAELAGLIGFVANTLALRADLTGDPTFHEALRRIRDVTLGALAHQDVPFERVVEALNPERRLSHAPLFQVMLAWQDAPLRELELPGLRLTPLPLDGGAAQFDLTLSIEERAGGLSCALEYAADLFDAATIRSFAESLRALLEGIVADPRRRISELPLVSAAARWALLTRWNDTAFPAPEGACLHHLVEEQAARAPGAIAVVRGAEALTYAELDAQATRLARRLRAAFVGPDRRVGLCVERSFDLVVGALAILKAGGAFVALDPGHPEERLERTARDARLAAILTRGGSPRVVVPGAARVDLDQQPPEDGLARDLDVAVSPDNLAYVIYTSGSTGQPKGVMLTHRGITSRLLWGRRTYPLHAGDRLLQLASPSFDVSVWELFTPLVQGATLVLLPPGVDPRAPAAIAEVIAAHRVTVVGMVPSLLQALLDEPHAARCASLRYVFAGAERLTEKVERLHFARLCAALYNLYGPTEATIDATFWRCDPADARRAVPIGYPIGNARAHVLDRRLEPVPVGVVGELYVGGVGLARGYLDRPRETALAFIPDPFGGKPGERLYRTGDLARRLPDGALEFIGRRDDQIKIRGHRIELGEIEALLAEHEAVAEAVVVAAAGATGEPTLIAYVRLADPARSTTGAELRASLRARVPSHLLPSAVRVLDAIPRTPSGKPDREALARVASAPAEQAPGRPLLGPVEEAVAAVWGELLGRREASGDDDFFQIGGHSLLGAQAAARLGRIFGVEIPIRWIFEAPRVAALAARIEEALTAGRRPAAPPLTALGCDEAPLSFAQQRLWFIDQLDPGQPIYNLPCAVRLRGPLDADALERSLQEISRRHEVLRARVELRGAQPWQVVDRAAELLLSRVDLRALPPGEREAEALQRATASAREPFDLSRAPLLRSLLIALDDRDHLLVVTMHHAASDGWSVSVLARELSEIYAALQQGAPPPRARPAIQYADHAAWQRSWLSGELLAEQLAYWEERLRGAPALLALPTDLPRPSVQGHAGGVVPVAIAREIVERLAALGRAEGATLFMALLAGYQALLYRYSGQSDVVVGAPIANRHPVETEELIGFFANTLALRTDLGQNPTFRELLARAREVTLGAYAHRDVPFERVVEALSPERDLGRSPLFQALFTLQNAPAPPLSLPGLAAEVVLLEMGTATFDLSLSLEETPEGLSGQLQYRADLFRPETARRMAAHLEALLRAAAADPDQRVHALPLLDDAERARLIAEGRGPDLDLPSDEGLHELFEAQARRTPDAIAVEHAGARLTYRELAERAARLALRLRAEGVGPEVRVAIHAERSPDAVIGLLATLKAGGAYVPLDPAHPRDRLAYLLDDAAAAVVLTERRLAAHLPPHGGRVVLLDDDGGAPAAALTPAPPWPRLSGGEIAYVLYTSGSTGRPKGVAVPHRAVVSFLRAMQRAPGIRPDDALLAVTTLAFDIAALEIFLPLTVGARLVLTSREDAQDGARLRALLTASGATVMQATPTTWQLLVASGWEGDARLKMLCGGEALSPRLAEELLARGGELWNMYGPTETTIWSSVRRIEPGVAPRLGPPIAGTQLHVLDGSLSLAPPGVPGELYIGGEGVSRGYLGRPALTAARFIPDPFGARPGARLYATGDRVRRLPGGDLEFLGRADQQIKLRGHRIELGEIEAALTRLPWVRQAVVTLRDDGPGGAYLAAYLVAGDAPAPLPPEIRRALLEVLPETLVPTRFVVLPALPLTPNGKVDRRALPAPERGAPGDPQREAPRTELERQVAEVWARVLGLDRVGIDDNFFEAGGNSLLAVELRDGLQRALGREIPLRRLFEAPTVRALVQHLEGEAPAGAPDREELRAWARRSQEARLRQRERTRGRS